MGTRASETAYFDEQWRLYLPVDCRDGVDRDTEYVPRPRPDGAIVLVPVEGNGE